jgi:hypothetical protein
MVSTNEFILTSDLHKILKFINVGTKTIENKHALTAVSLTMSDHAARIRQAIEEVRYVSNIAIQVCLHWRNGIIQPQVLPPSLLI